MDIIGLGRVGVYNGFLDYGSIGLADKVWVWMKEWFVGEVKFFLLDSEDSNSFVERVMRKEVVGKGWVELMILEIDIIGKEIEGKLFEEFVEEFVFFV